MRIGILLLACLMAGCATPKITPVTRFVLEPRVQPAQAQPCGKTLGIRPLEAARPYRQKIVFRGEQYALDSYDTYEWSELPRDIVTRALADALTASRRFSDVGDAANMVTPDLMLTGEVRRFDLLRSAQPWAAQCEIHLELREAESAKLVWSGTIAESENLSADDVHALPEAMNKVLDKVLAKAVSEMIAR